MDQGGVNVSFSENFLYVLNSRSPQDHASFESISAKNIKWVFVLRITTNEIEMEKLSEA